MRLYNKELKIQQGEEFAIDWELTMENGDPYIVSSKLSNPMIQIVISSTNYAQPGVIKYKNNAYGAGNREVVDTGQMFNYYLEVKDTFLETTPVAVSEHYDMIITNGGYPLSLLPYVKNKAVIKFDYNSDFTLPDDWEYYYCTGYSGSKYSWEEYHFRIVKTFRTEDTKQWTEHDYTYAINLVAGKTTEERLNEIYESIETPIATKKNNKIDLYNQLYEYDRKLVKDINLDKVFYDINYKQVIVEPTKLTVTNDIFGGNY